MALSPEAIEKLAALKEKFAARLQTDLDRIAALTPEQITPEAIRDTVHKLAGTAGTYGYSELSQQMKEIEQDIIAAAESNTFEALAIQQRICKALNEAIS